MIRLLLLLATLAPAAEQMQPWVDLSGPWRSMEARDDPRFADPSFDDSSWPTLTVPLKDALLFGGAFHNNTDLWLRRKFDLDPAASRTALALTVGGVSESFEVFVNGKRVGGTGELSVRESHLRRAWTFDLPALDPGPITIAIHARRFDLRGTLVWLVPDAGPYVLTGQVNAPRSEGALKIAERRISREANLIFGVAELPLCLFILAVFISETSRKELFWLALFGASMAVAGMNMFLWIDPQSTPWPTGAFIQWFTRTALAGVTLLEFSMAELSVRSRWVRGAAWGALLFTLAVPEYRIWELRVSQALIPGVLAYWGLRPGRTRLRREMLTAAGIALVWFTHGQNVHSAGTIFMSPAGRAPILYVAGLQISLLNLSIFTGTFVMAIVLVRRMIIDRLAKASLSMELEEARAVQQILLAGQTASSPTYQIDTAYHSARQTSGDFFYVGETDTGRTLVVLGDVSGKGLRAAMVMSSLVGIIRDRRSDDPAELLRHLNGALHGAAEGFTTCVALVLDQDGSGVCASAGHLAPWRNGEELAVAPGLPLGLSRDADWDVSTLHLAIGDHLTVVSDGVVEAANAKGELFGFDRTREIAGKSAREIADTAKTWGQNDDITVVTVRRTT